MLDLHTTKIATGVGADSLHLALLRHVVADLTDAFTPMINSSFSPASSLDCGRPVTITTIPKSSGSTALANVFAP